MRTPECPFDGEAPGDGAPSYEWLDEWLCEYVDGTMDPSVEAVFEQYVKANPELKAHVERLRQTREILRDCDAPETPLPEEVQTKACSEMEKDLFQSPAVFPDETGERSAAALGIASSIAVALVVGFLAGSMLVDPDTFSSASMVSTAEEQSPSQTLMRSDAASRPGRAPPTPQSQESALSAGEALAPRPAAAPLSSPDTMSPRPAFTTVGE